LNSLRAIAPISTNPADPSRKIVVKAKTSARTSKRVQEIQEDSIRNIFSKNAMTRSLREIASSSQLSIDPMLSTEPLRAYNGIWTQRTEARSRWLDANLRFVISVDIFDGAGDLDVSEIALYSGNLLMQTQ